MRFVPLSDHPGDMLAQARREREAQARERRDKARGDRDLVSRLRWAVTAWWRRLARPPRRPAVPVLSSPGEEAIKGGIKGEREVADVLRAALDDAWVLVKGYRNRRGEIDYLLLGPGGLFAIEVKYVNGTFTITRERWRYTRYDNYGNQVGGGFLQDARRRPPSVQLAEPLAMLEQFLASRSAPARMRAVVLLNHPKARISERTDDVGAEVLTATVQLRDLVLAADERIDRGRLAEIERLVIRDHRFHEERRPVTGPARPVPRPEH